MEILGQILLFLDSVTGNLGIALIVFTLAIRFLLIPLTVPSLKAGKKMRDLQPELKKLKDKHGKNKQAFQVAQMELYKKYNVNPLAGCIPQLVQIGVLILLYQFLIDFLNSGTLMIDGTPIDTSFLWMNLASRDETFILPVLAGATQLILSLMIAPGAEVPDIVPNKSKSKKVQKANEKEEDIADMAASMQKQMLFVMPIMTGFIAVQFPAGLGLYWTVTNIFSIVQQYYISGWGGLQLYAQRLFAFVSPSK